MTPLIRAMIVAIASLLLLAPMANAQSGSREEAAKLYQSLTEIEISQELVRRLIPPEFDEQSERAAIDKLAGEAGLPPLKVQFLPDAERVTLDDGQPSPIVLRRAQLVGTGAWGDVHFFFSMLLLRPRMTGLDSLHIEAAEAGSVRVKALVVYPVWTDEGVPRPARSGDVLVDLRARVERARALRDRIVAATSRLTGRRHSVDALARLTTAIEEHPIAFTSAKIGDRVVIEGLALGEAARARLAGGLKHAGLDGRVEWTRAGSCLAFSVTAQGPGADAGEFESGAPLFDRESAEFCRAEQTPVRRLAVRGRGTAGAPALRLRGVELADVFLVLNHYIGENFIIASNDIEDAISLKKAGHLDKTSLRLGQPTLPAVPASDVQRRVDLDVAPDASVDDILGTLRAAGLTIGAAPLRHVSSTARAAGNRPAGGGPPISLSLKHAAASDVVCMLGNILERELHMARDDVRAVSIFATEVPAEVVLAALVTNSNARGVNPCGLDQTPQSRLRKHAVRAESAAIADLRLAGLALVGDDRWHAYAYLPGNRLTPLETGDRIADGSVESIGPNGVRFTTKDGAADVPLR